jgi:hypothetical protein
VVMLNAALQAAAQVVGIQSQVTDSETLVVA